MERQFGSRSIDAPNLAAFARANGWTQWPPPKLDLNALAIIAAFYSPDVDVARAQVAMAKAAIETARARVNPSISADGGYSRQPDAHVVYAVTPTFTVETAGKRGLRVLTAEQNKGAAELSLIETEWAVWSKVRMALAGYLLADRRLQLLKEQTEIRSDIDEMITLRVRVGALAQPESDVYRIELLRAQSALVASRGDLAAKLSLLSTAAGLPPDVVKPATLSFPSMEHPPEDLRVDLKRVERTGLLHRADVRRMVLEYAAGETALRLEIARQYPDLQLGPTYGFEEGFARYTFGAASALPIFQQNHGPIYEAEAKRRELESRLRLLQIQAVGETDRALKTYGAAIAGFEASGRTVEASMRREAAAKRALDVGQGDRLALMLARLESNSARLAQLDALSQVQASLAALENAVQHPLETGVQMPLLWAAEEVRGAQQ